MTVAVCFLYRVLLHSFTSDLISSWDTALNEMKSKGNITTLLDVVLGLNNNFWCN